MKIAAVSIAGERRVGRITSDLPMSETQDGIIALIRSQ
jgi:hypothetical protein